MMSNRIILHAGNLELTNIEKTGKEAEIGFFASLQFYLPTATVA